MARLQAPPTPAAFIEVPPPFRHNIWLQLYCIFFGLFWLYSGFTSPDVPNWLAENTLTISAVILLVAFYPYFRFSTRSYSLIFIYLLLHVYGSRTAYAENPLGLYLQDALGQERNHYDRLVHFGFGLLLAYPMQDLYCRAFKGKKWAAYWWPLELTLGLSAFYEVVEWLVAGVFFPELGTTFLGLQGDEWDPQKDMFLAVTGAALAMLFLKLYRRYS